jgi:hypothetical protein
MSDERARAVSVERLLGSELAAAAEEALVGVWFGAFRPELAARLATAHGFLELYWDLRRHRLTAPATGVSVLAVVGDWFGMSSGFPGEPVCAERRAVSSEINAMVWGEHLLGGGLSSAAGEQLVDASSDVSGLALAVRRATAQVLLALYWELCHQHPAPAPVAGDDGPEPGQDHPWSAVDDASLEWVSALLCAPPSVDQGPDDFAVWGGGDTPGVGLEVHHL